MDFDNRVIAIIKKPSGSKFFLRKGGGICSLLTQDCIFDRPHAWAESRQYTEAHGNEDIIVFRTVGDFLGIFGKTPDDILSAKKEALLRFCKKYKSIQKENMINEKKKAKTSAEIIEGGLFETLD